MADYLRRTRGVLADPRHIVLRSGATQAIALLASVLSDQTLAMEDPGFWLHRMVLRHNGIEPIPVPVDEDGLDVASLADSDATVVLATPAHQAPTGVVFSAACLDGNSVPQVCYLTCVRDVDLLEAHRFSAGVFEQAGAVAEKHRCYRHQHLVEHTGRKALRGDTGAKDVDVLVARSDARFGDGRFDVANERHTRPTLIRWSMRQDNLWAVPAAAEHLSLALLALVGIVAAEGPVAHEDRTRLSDQLVHNRIRPEMIGHPGHIATRSRDEAVE